MVRRLTMWAMASSRIVALTPFCRVAHARVYSLARLPPANPAARAGLVWRLRARLKKSEGTTMGMTMTEKVLARAGKTATVKPGDVAVVEVETSVLMDMTFLPEGWVEVLKVHDPKKVAIVFDHLAPA